MPRIPRTKRNRMYTPPDQSSTPELPATNEITRPEWIPPQLDKLPVSSTAVAGAGSIVDGIDFSS